MKKFISGTLVALALAAAFPAFAVGPSSNNASKQDKSVAPNSTSGMSEIQKARVLEARKKELKRLVDNQKELVGRLVSRFQNLVRLIESRRDKMAAEGIDVTDLDALIAKAKIQQGDALKLLAVAKEKSAAISTAEDPRAAAREFIAANNDLKKKLVELKDTLRQISAKMKELVKAKKEELKQNKKASGETETESEGDTNE